jgi:hypothetical protein
VAAAAQCNDADFVWDRTDPVIVRQASFTRALSTLPPDAFAPFSKQAWVAYAMPDFCLNWPAPTRFAPAVPKGAVVTSVPTLILSGGLDTGVPTENTRILLTAFPRAQFLGAPGGGLERLRVGPHSRVHPCPGTSERDLHPARVRRSGGSFVPDHGSQGHRSDTAAR